MGFEFKKDTVRSPLESSNPLATSAAPGSSTLNRSPNAPKSSFDPSAIPADLSIESVTGAMKMLSDGLARKIASLEMGKMTTTAPTLMREYLEKWRTLLTKDFSANEEQSLLDRIAKIETSLSAGSNAKMVRFAEFRDHTFRVARNIQNGEHAQTDTEKQSALSDTDRVMLRVTEQLPRVFSALTTQPKTTNQENPFRYKEITVTNAMIAIDAMIQAGFPFETNRALFTKWLATFMAESKLNYKDTTGDRGTSWGIGQVHWTVHDLKDYGLKNRYELLDPIKNMQFCFQLSEGAKKFGPWHAYKKHGSFLPDARLAMKMYEERQATLASQQNDSERLN